MAIETSEIEKYVMSFVDEPIEDDVLELDTNIVEYLLDNCQITIPEENRFFINVNCEGIMRQLMHERGLKYYEEVQKSEFAEGVQSMMYTGNFDFSHTTAEWESVIPLGIVGLRDRVARYAQKNDGDARKQRFYSNVIKAYDAAIRFIKRAAKIARDEGRNEMAQGLENLAKGAPSNLYEALQLTLVYYYIQQMTDGSVLRTLGRLDALLYEYYIKEEKEYAKKMIGDYLLEIDTIKAYANIPFAICGSDMDGNSTTNELSYVLLDSYKEMNVTDTKLHIMCNKKTPDDIIASAFDGIRNGRNSIVFMSDEKVIESLIKHGEDIKDAVNYHIVGCYECGGVNELTCSCNGYINLAKVLEVTLNNGKDMLTGKLIGLENDGKFESFDALWKEYERQLVYACECGMKVTNICESHYNKIHSAPILSGTYTSALEKGGDLYCDYTAKYNNSSLNGVGLATATDSLAAIKKIVFEDKEMTLEKLVDIIRSNWEGEEALRLRIKNKFPRYGMGDDKTDVIAGDIVDILTNTISGKPNAKGGKFRVGLFSINHRWKFGEKTAASADGRFSGETISQNTSATFGADKNGMTAHLLSVSKINMSNTPNGAIVDIDLHSSAVGGDEGLANLSATLRAFFELGGFAVHYNVLDTQTLIDARDNPEKYPTLMVRLCGWSVLFSSLSRKEMDEFISRSMK